MQTARRAGFSLIEALVVLAIGGMALAVIFSIGIRAGDTGFSLGRRAMSVADADVAISDLRAIIRSISVRPPISILEGVDQPIVASPERLEADVVMERATGCAPQGWAGRLTLSIEPQAGERVLMCQAGPRKTPIMTLPRGARRLLLFGGRRDLVPLVRDARPRAGQPRELAQPEPMGAPDRRPPDGCRGLGLFRPAGPMDTF